MWPWLVGAGVIALLATSSGKAVAPAPLAPSAPSRPGSVSSNVPLTPGNIQKAQSIALARETNVANLTSFGNALISYGYAALGQALLNKTLTPAQSAAKGPANIDSAWLPMWVNLFAGTHYSSGQAVSASDLAKAVHSAIAKGTTDQLTGFANALTAAGQSAYALQLQAQVAALKGHGGGGHVVSVPTAPVATKPGTYTTTHGQVKRMTAAQKAASLAQLQADLTAHGGFGAPSAADAARIRAQIKALQATPTRG